MTNLDPLWEDPNAPWHSRDHPAEGYTRVWFDSENFLDYSAEDFNANFLDNNITGFYIQPDPWHLENIDSETITLYYANGLTWSVQLGLIGTPAGIVDRYLLKDSLIMPATPSLEVSLSEHYIPNLFLLRMSIHKAIQQALIDRLELAYIVAAFAQVFTITSGGGDPGIADSILKKAHEAAEIESNR